MEIIPLVQGKDVKSHIFMEDYKQYCKLYNIRSNPFIAVDLSNNCLDFSADKLHHEDWMPILEAISNDRSLHFISVRRGRAKSKIFQKPKNEPKEKQVFTPNSSNSRQQTKSETLHEIKKEMIIPHSIIRHTKSEVIQETKRGRRPFTPKLSPDSVIDNLADALSICLSQSPSIRGLLLESFPLTCDSFKKLIHGIKASKYIQQLSLPYTLVGDEGCAALCNILRNRSNLVCINLTGCELTHIGIESLCNLIKFQKLHRYGESWKQSLRGRNVDPNIMPGLRRLTLNHNSIGDAGVKILVETLIDDLWVKALDLQDCGITSIGGEDLLKLITENECLSVVDVRGNKELSSSLLVTVVQKLSDRDCEEFQWLKEDGSRKSNLPCSSRSMQKSKFGSFFSNTTISVLPKKGRMVLPHAQSLSCQTRPSSSKCNKKPCVRQPPWNRNNNNLGFLRKGKSDTVISIKKTEMKANNSNEIHSYEQKSVVQKLQNITLEGKHTKKEQEKGSEEDQEIQATPNNCKNMPNEEIIEDPTCIESVISTLNEGNGITLPSQIMDCGSKVDAALSKPHTIFELLLSN